MSSSYRGPVLTQNTVRHVSNGPYTSKTGEIDNGKILSSLMKADISFKQPMDEHEFSEGRVSAIMTTV